MRNLDYDTLGMGWSPNPQDGQWKSDSPYRGGQWRRAQEEPVVENDLCFAKWTNETTWSYGSGSTERTPGVERDHYGRKIWQGNEYLARCPDVPSNIMVKGRLVAAYLFMSLYEDNDHSTSLENRKSAQPAAGFVHRFKTYGVEWQFPCPYGAIVTRSGKAIPFPCPTLASKNNSWAMVIDPGRKYYW